MKLFVLLLVTFTLHVSSSAPSKGQRLQPFEQTMLDKLHQPWFQLEKLPEYPRKGETKCKGGVCKPKKGCEDCQYAKPIDF